MKITPIPTPLEADKAAPSRRIYSTAQICELIGCNRTSLWRMCRDDRFPKPLHVMNNKRGWLRADYDEWLADLVAKRDAH